MLTTWLVPHNRWVCRGEYITAVKHTMQTAGYVGQGGQVQLFEAELANRFRPAGAACCVNSGTAALWLAYVLQGGPWTLPTYACAALYLAAREAQPQIQTTLVDCDDDGLTPDASVVVHTYGALSDVRKGAIEDFTHAPGAIGAGTYGALSIISFGATKPLGVGAGGALLGPADVIDEAKRMRDYDAWNGHKRCYNVQMSDIHAAIGRERLLMLDQDNAWRRHTAARYSQALVDVGLGHKAPYARDVYYRYVLKLPDWSVALTRLAGIGVEAINPLLPDELLHRRLGLSGRQFPTAEALAQRTISLPIWPGMAEHQVELVCKGLRMLHDMA